MVWGNLQLWEVSWILASGEFAVLLCEISLFRAMSYISWYGSFCDLPFPFNDVRTPNIGSHYVLSLKRWCSSDPHSCSASLGDKGWWVCDGHRGKEGSVDWRMGRSLMKLRPCRPHQAFLHHCFCHYFPQLAEVSSCSLAGKLVSWPWNQKSLCSQLGLSNWGRAGEGEMTLSWASDGFPSHSPPTELDGGALFSPPSVLLFFTRRNLLNCVSTMWRHACGLWSSNLASSFPSSHSWVIGGFPSRLFCMHPPLSLY